MIAARRVEVPDRALSASEVEELRTHARNSALWQFTHYQRSIEAVLDRLYAKGFPREGVVTLDTDGNHVLVDIPAEVVDALVSSGQVDEEENAVDLAHSMVTSWKSRQEVYSRLSERLFPRDLVKRVVDEVCDEDRERSSLCVMAGNLTRTSRWRQADSSARRRLLVRKAVSRGFSTDLAREWLEENQDEVERSW